MITITLLSPLPSRSPIHHVSSFPNSGPQATQTNKINIINKPDGDVANKSALKVQIFPLHCSYSRLSLVSGFEVHSLIMDCDPTDIDECICILF